MICFNFGYFRTASFHHDFKGLKSLLCGCYSQIAVLIPTIKWLLKYQMCDDCWLVNASKIIPWEDLLRKALSWTTGDPSSWSFSDSSEEYRGSAGTGTSRFSWLGLYLIRTPGCEVDTFGRRWLALFGKRVGTRSRSWTAENVDSFCRIRSTSLRLFFFFETFDFGGFFFASSCLTSFST